MGTLKSESFVNDAADAAGLFQSDGSLVTNAHVAAAPSFTISYNAGTQSYTVSTGSRTQTFTPADQLASGSSDFTAYQKSAGSLREALSLTVPGTSGALQYQYVGGGAWERQTSANGGTTLDFTYNPFTYGIVTPDANLARSGTATYKVSLVGVYESDLPYAMAGSGTMQVDFSAGQLSSTGPLTTIDVKTGVIKSLGWYYGSAQLSSTSNAFSGTFAMDDGARYTGGWKGRFYGPANQEVGAIWYIDDGAGTYGSGYLIGRTDNSVVPINTSLTSLQFSEDFQSRYSELDFHDNGDGTANTGSALLRSDGKLSFNVSAQSFRYVDAGQGIDTSFQPSDLNSGASTSSLAVYDITLGGQPYRLSLSKAGAGNPTIALNYVSFGHWQQFQNGATDARDRWFAWGVRSNAFQIPTGTGHYDGIILGTGATATASGGQIFNVTGTSAFDVDFGAGSFTGSLHPIGTSQQNGSTRDFGIFAITGGAMNIDGGLNGQIVDGSSNYLGYFEGALYGPRAEEIGGSVGFTTTVLSTYDPAYQTKVNITGVVVGKR